MQIWEYGSQQPVARGEVTRAQGQDAARLYADPLLHQALMSAVQRH